MSRIHITSLEETKVILAVEKDGEESVEHVFRRLLVPNISFRTIDFGENGVVVFNDTGKPVKVILVNSHLLVLDAGASSMAFHLSENTGSLSRFTIETEMMLEPYTGFRIFGSMTFLSAF